MSVGPTNSSSGGFGFSGAGGSGSTVSGVPIASVLNGEPAQKAGLCSRRRDHLAQRLLRRVADGAQHADARPPSRRSRPRRLDRHVRHGAHDDDSARKRAGHLSFPAQPCATTGARLCRPASRRRGSESGRPERSGRRRCPRLLVTATGHALAEVPLEPGPAERRREDA